MTQNELQNENGEISLSELTRRYLKMDFESDNTKINYYPLAIHPTYLDERMNAQKTCFTVYGDKINGLLSSDNNSKFLSSVTIEGGLSKSKMLQELRVLGIDFESIYPDLDGIGLSINDSFKRNFSDNRETMFHIFNSIQEKIDIVTENEKPSR